ncbi:MAG: hypothetical protein AAFV19_12660 [Pseudomonadota bacterium]
MADNKVSQSIEAPGGQRCIDIFQRPDGRWGASEFRRDPEDARGWYPTHACPDTAFDSAEEALAAARLACPWIADL